MQILIIGGGFVGRTLAARFEDDDETVVFLDEERQIVERACNSGIDAVETIINDIELPQNDDIDRGAVVVVAAMDRDSANLLVIQLLRVRFDVDHVIAKINDPRNRSSFEDLDIETVCSTKILVNELCETITPHRIAT